jgi:FG-GAP-like repeat/Abnormal spindle-like microcephaly-assoc'd, ASPM-SPD-2-Hydin
MNKNCFFCLALWFAAGLAQAQSNPVPFLNQPLLPTGATPGSPGFTLTVNGTGFASASVVKWNATSLPTTFVSNSQLTATALAGDVATPGTASVTVTTPGPGGGTSNVEFFTISPTTTPGFTNYDVVNVPQAETNLGESPIAVDVNGDGKLDIIAGYFDRMVVLLGNGDGSFQPAALYAFGDGNSGEQVNSVAVGDFNGDGKLDVAVGGGDTNVVSVLLGNGDGTFQSANNLPQQTGYFVSAVAVGDFNGDGKLDLITANVPSPFSTSSSGPTIPMLSVFLGNGDGTFQSPINLTTGTHGAATPNILVGDLNGDGKLDVVAFSSVLLGNGDGTLGTPSSIPYGCQQLALPDVNGDGKLDLLGIYSPNLAVCLGNGDGTFMAAATYSLPGSYLSYPSALTVGDFNADGKLDVAVANAESANTSISYGNGDGTFQAGIPYPSALWGGGLTNGDFNGDGKQDIFLTPTDTNNLMAIIMLQGSFPLLSPAPGSLSFAQQAIGSTSTAQTVVLTNSGSATLTISSTAITGADAGNYAESSSCGASLAVNASCQVSVTFAPTAEGTRNAVLSISDNAPGSPQTVSLAGMTTPAPTLTLSPSSITFPGQYVGTSGLPLTVTATNAGNAPLTIGSVTTSSKDFGVLNACGGSLAAGSSCSIGVFFDPASSGSISGTFTIADNAGGSPQIVPLSGMGQDFSFTSSSSTQTISPGATAKYTMAINPIAGFNQTVALACSGVPTGSSCSLSSNSVTLSGSTPASVTVSVTTLGNSIAGAQPRSPSSPSTQIRILFAICGLPGLLLWGGSRRVSGKRKTAGICIALLGIVCLVTAGCGGNSSSGGGGTPASTYTLTVTGTFASGSANLTHSTNLTLVVQ